jgi:hypothetical protein
LEGRFLLLTSLEAQSIAATKALLRNPHFHLRDPTPFPTSSPYTERAEKGKQKFRQQL